MREIESRDLEDLMVDGVFEGRVSHVKDLPQHGLRADLWVIGRLEGDISYAKAVYLAEGSAKPHYGAKVRVEKKEDYDLPVVTVL